MKNVIKFLMEMAGSKVLMRVCYMGPDLVLEMRTDSSLARIDIERQESFDDFIYQVKCLRKRIEKKEELLKCKNSEINDAVPAYTETEAVAVKKFAEELKQVHGISMYNETFSGIDDALCIRHKDLDDFVKRYLKEKGCKAEETSEDSNVGCENSGHLSKPPLGVKPHAIAYEERIRELLGAVERNFEHMKTCCMTSEERLGRLHISSDWLQEALLLMELMDKLDEKEDKK